jgi:hypothetical protein
MHKGKLREIGTHQELMEQQGIYWRLYQLQYEGNGNGNGNAGDGRHSRQPESALNAGSVSPQTEL